MLSRLRSRIRTFVVTDATPQEEALDSALREHERRVSARFTLMLLLVVSAALWAAIIHIAKAVL